MAANSSRSLNYTRRAAHSWIDRIETHIYSSKCARECTDCKTGALFPSPIQLLYILETSVDRRYGLQVFFSMWNSFVPLSSFIVAPSVAGVWEYWSVGGSCLTVSCRHSRSVSPFLVVHHFPTLYGHLLAIRHSFYVGKRCSSVVVFSSQLSKLSQDWYLPYWPGFCFCSFHTHFAIIRRHFIHASFYFIWLVSVYEWISSH